jgi:4-amino-4-deoxy-L-arabinose transferase-like glycosyltransferase
MTAPASPSSWSRDLLLLALALVVVFGYRLGSHALYNPDEGRYAEVPREMVATGDWVTPHLDGVKYLEKPPLMYWAVALCLEAFGPSEWSVRAPVALFGLAGVLLTYAAGRRLYGRAAGLLAAAVLATSLLYFVLARLLIIDMAVSVLIAATLFCFILGVGEPPGPRRRWLFYGLYASAALATLAKGLIGFLVPGAVMFLWLLLLQQWRRLRPMFLPTGAAIFLALAAPWHVLAAVRNPEWARFYLLFEHWDRFFSPSHKRTEPWWFFLPILLLGLFPWVGFLWPALRRRLAGGWARRGENAVAWFLVIWAGFILLFFSASESKLAPYILPVFPALAVLIGAELAAAAAAHPADGRRGAVGGFSFLCGLLAVALGVAVLKPGVLRDSAQALELRPYAYGMAAVLVFGGIAGFWAARARGLRAALGVLAATALAFYALLVLATPYIRPGTKPLALELRKLVRPGDRVYTYHGFFHDLTYYARRDVGTVAYKDELEIQFLDPADRAARFIDDAEFRREWAGPGRIFAVARRQDVGPLFGDPTFHYHLLGETPGHYLFSNQP